MALYLSFVVVGAEIVVVIGGEMATADLASGLSLSDEELLAVAGIDELMAEYESKGSKYTLSTTCKQFVSSLAAGKTRLKVGSLSMEGVAHSRFVDTVELLAKELVEYQEAENELARVAQRIEDGGFGDENSNQQQQQQQQPRVLAGAGAAREIHREYLQNEKMLSKLLEEQASVDAAIRQKEARKEQVLKSLENEAGELSSTSSAPVKSVMSSDPYAAAEQREFAERLAKIESAKQDAETLLEGLQGLVGLTSIEIEPSGVRKGVQVVVEVGAFGAILLLDGERRLVDIALTRGSYAHVADILSEAIALPSPQDLRFAVFALGAVQRSAAALALHTAELRKRCIVRSAGFSAASSCASVQLTLSNGVTCSLSVHPCYPEVPGGVSIDSLVGVGGWTMQELEAMRVTANARCFSSLLDVHADLLAVTEGR